MQQAKKLIEVAMPIKEISAESVRDKSIRHGHISTLHLWWARRPLPVCRAVVFASLIPDPLDDNCPQNFRDSIELLLGARAVTGDPYKPYQNIPYTSAIDIMEDNLRNRLLMFIGKFSERFAIDQRSGKMTPSNEQLSEHSLIKWENKNDKTVIGRARKLIWVAHNSKSGGSAMELLSTYAEYEKAIEDAEHDLYTTHDRDVMNSDILYKEKVLTEAIEAFLNKMPKVFDPFAGGGAIPLEAARLGCRAYGNDINPVAHIIQKASVEFPQKFGKPIIYARDVFISRYGEKAWKEFPAKNKVIQNGKAIAAHVENRLSFDVNHLANNLIDSVGLKLSDLYEKNGHGHNLFINYWARIGTCINPSCRAQVPLLKQFYIVNPRGSGNDLSKKLFLSPVINGTSIKFEIGKGIPETDPWINRGHLTCPCCGSVTEADALKKQFVNNQIEEKVIYRAFESDKGYVYEIADESGVFEPAEDVEVPVESMQPNSAGGDTFSWGFTKWGQLFSKRQLAVLHAFVRELKTLDSVGTDEDYNKAVHTYLAILINRIAIRGTSFGKWHVLQATVEHLFGRQAIQMNFDYPEINPFGNSSGSARGQLEWIINYINSESKNAFVAESRNASSGERTQFEQGFINATVTDPPYYDAIAYADISDFFYVWFKRTLGDTYPLNFSTPQTPKSEECTALKHHHHNSYEEAKKHFESKLLQIFDAIEHQTSDLISIMFAHQSTEAWTTLCNSILGARMNITGSWATDTEITGALKTNKAFLSSSVTVSAKPTVKSGFGDFMEVKKAIESTVDKEVNILYRLGFRGADLLTACFGQAVSEFGKFEKVEKSDGSEVSVAELLELAREAAFNALLKGFDGDDFTKFYIGWVQLYGFEESDFDDAAKFSRVGLSINVQELFIENILIKNGNKQTLGGFQERLEKNQNIGVRIGAKLIDQVHKAMDLYKAGNRIELLEYLKKIALNGEGSFWRVLTSLCEVLPAGTEDLKQALGLLTNKESLLRDAKQAPSQTNQQVNITFEE